MPSNTEDPLVSNSLPNVQTAEVSNQVSSPQMGCGFPPPITSSAVGNGFSVPESSAPASNLMVNAQLGESVPIDPLPSVTLNDIDIFVDHETKIKIWNGEYIDLTNLLKQNFIVDQNPSGPLALQNRLLVVQTTKKKIKQISSIEMWIDAFINFISIYIEKHPEKVVDLLKYLVIIRDTASDNQIQKWIAYDQQFCLRMSKNPHKSWSTIDGHLWPICGLTGSAYNKDPSTSNSACYDYNYKGFCSRMNCFYSHLCIKCSMSHPINACSQFNYQMQQQNFSNGSLYGSNIHSNQPQ